MKAITLRLTDKEQERVKWLQDVLGLSESAAIRLAINRYHQYMSSVLEGERQHARELFRHWPPPDGGARTR